MKNGVVDNFAIEDLIVNLVKKGASYSVNEAAFSRFQEWKSQNSLKALDLNQKKDGIPLSVVLLTYIFLGNDTLNLLKEMLTIAKLDWNAQITDKKAPNKGLTPFYFLLATAFNAKQPEVAIAVLSQVLAQRGLDWNVPITGEGPDKGKTPLYLLVFAAAQAKQEALMVLRQVLSQPGLAWNAPVTGEGPNKGNTPLHLLVFAAAEGRQEALTMLGQVLSQPGLDWNVPITGEGPNKGKTPLYMLLLAACGAKQEVLAMLGQVLSQPGLDWNVPVTGEGPGKGSTPLYLLLLAAFNAKQEALAVLSQVLAQPGLDWNARVTWEGQHKGKTPLYLLVVAAFYGKYPEAWATLEAVLEQHLDISFNLEVELNGQVREKLSPVKKATLDLWLSLNKARSLFKLENNTELENHLEKTEDLAQAAFEAGEQAAYFYMVKFYTHILDFDNTKRWVDKISPDNPGYTAANLLMVKLCKEVKNLPACKEYVKKISKNCDEHRQAQEVLADMLFVNVRAYLKHAQTDTKEKRDEKKTSNQARRNELWAAYEAALSAGVTPVTKDLRSMIAFNYIYGSNMNTPPRESEIVWTSLISAPEPAILRKALDASRGDFLRNRKKIKALKT